MKVVFLADVSHKGRKGEIKDVADGYARNYLLPNKLAMIASSSAIKMMEVQNEADKHKQAREQEEIDALLQNIRGKELKFKAKAGAKDRIHGSITAANIAEQLTSLVGYEIDKKKIVIDEPLKQIGEHEVTVNFVHNKEAKIKVIIEGE
jgi:large subunit ribosomal protein L9